MRRGALSAAVLAACVMATACRPADAAKRVRPDTAELTRREQRLQQALQSAQPGTALGTPDSTATDSATTDSVTAADTAMPASTTSEEKEKGKKSDDDNKKSDKETAADDSTVAVRAGALARWVLPRELDEISGVALTSDGRLLAHGDERAQISEIDYRRGVVTKQFVVGAPTIKGDLEGIAVANDVVFMLASNGTLYEFREGMNGQRVGYITSDTRLGKECEFEGLAFDPAINSLLLACKNVEIKTQKDSLVIYRWKLGGGGERLSKLTVPLARILGAIGEKELHPSDITVDPKTGHYVIIASIEEAILEITPTGDVVFARKLAGQHDQPESIAITKDGILIIGDEAGRRPAVITLYRWPQ